MSRPTIRAVPAIKNTVMVVDDQSTGTRDSRRGRPEYRRQHRRSSRSRARSTRSGGPRPIPADLVLVDYQMPEIDGIEFVRRLRLLPEYAHVPMVMVTVHDDRKVRYAALDAGITDFLTKPIDTRECLARCRNLLTLRRQQLALEDKGRLLEGMVQEATQEVRSREKETLFRLAKAGRIPRRGNRQPRHPHGPLFAPDRRGDRSRRAGVGDDRARRAAARHRQDRPPGPHPAQGRQADRDRGCA